ncbi:MAG: class I SAM-dependent methyltransferase [Clostridia bacterium]|nr:class I SAM-dependent methyltransferase [Clostridia bacterium]
MIYDLLAPFYDAINGEVDYKSWADFIEKIIKKELKFTPELVLDLGCGTGKMTRELSSRGYDMTGVDYSPEMLGVARYEAEQEGLDILWLCQNMCELDLYGTVDLAVSCLDCINHLTTKRELSKCFSLVHNFLTPDGLFIFDINGRAKFENIYADKTYAMDEDGAFCVWQNFYDKKSKLCDFYITLFKENATGGYERFDEEQRERMYTVTEIEEALIKAGLEPVGAYSDFDFTRGDDKSERIYFVARCIKPKTYPKGEEK